MGHWKVLTTEYHVDKGQEDFKFKQRAILQLHVDLMNYCLKWDYSFDRWQKIVTCMIFKEPGNIKIHRLRVIHIYEADLSALLGIKWRQLTHELLKRKFFHPGLLATIPTKTVHDPVLNTVLQYEFSRITCTTVVKGKSDATACYDRIVPSIASAVSQLNGMPKSICIVHAKTLKEAQYYIKLMFRISEENYKHSVLIPIYGAGQGSSSSPYLWLFVSNVIFQAYSSLAHGAVYADPQNQMVVSVFILGRG